MRASKTASAVNMEDMIQWGSPGLENRDVDTVGGGSNPLSSADDVSNGCYTRPVKPWPSAWWVRVPRRQREVSASVTLRACCWVAPRPRKPR